MGNSPLAYPANSYHRLIKNYQLVRDSINDPLQDALLLAGKVFAEQWEALLEQFGANAGVVRLYRGLLATDPSAGNGATSRCDGSSVSGAMQGRLLDGPDCRNHLLMRGTHTRMGVTLTS